MQETNCPICYTALEVREVTPCDDCGWDPAELEHLSAGKHIYSEYEIFANLHLILCNFCAVDFSCYDPTYFGLAKGSRVGFGKMNLLKEINLPSTKIDKFCSHCAHRLSFLKFVVNARELHKSEHPGATSTTR